jgi:N-acetylneuraminate lyase
MPTNMVLHAPYVAFNNDSSINLEPIPQMAAFVKKMGVTTIWIVGAMGQFEALTKEERMAVSDAWIKAGHENGLYVIVHVMSTVLADAVAMAKHAKQSGADAIACMPPYIHPPDSFNTLFEYLAPIVAAAVDLPLFYYHLPSQTHYDPSVFEMMKAAATGCPALMGVKWVGDSASDWFSLVQSFNSSRALLPAPEPKMQWFGLGMGRGTVLAEDFFAPTYLRMYSHYFMGDMKAAWAEQTFKMAASPVFGKYGGAAAECVIYCKLDGFNIGSGRLSQLLFDELQYDALVADLEAVGFFAEL